MEWWVLPASDLTNIGNVWNGLELSMYGLSKKIKLHQACCCNRSKIRACMQLQNILFSYMQLYLYEIQLRTWCHFESSLGRNELYGEKRWVTAKLDKTFSITSLASGQSNLPDWETVMAWGMTFWVEKPSGFIRIGLKLVWARICPAFTWAAGLGCCLGCCLFLL